MQGFTRRFASLRLYALAASVALLAATGLALGPAGPARAQADTASAEVTKIDKPGGRVTLKHDGIRGLDMPPMVMAFRVVDPRVLDTLAVGERVRFTAERINGQYTLTALNKAP